MHIGFGMRDVHTWGILDVLCMRRQGLIPGKEAICARKGRDGVCFYHGFC